MTDRECEAVAIMSFYAVRNLVLGYADLRVVHILENLPAAAVFGDRVRGVAWMVVRAVNVSRGVYGS